MRIVAVFFIVGILLSIPFLVWGEGFERTFTMDGAVDWLVEQGDWAWALALLLLIGDLLLPLPSTAILSGLGIVYGPIGGGAIGAVGSVLAGLLAYGICRRFGRAAARRIAGASDLERSERIFASVGGWVVALSRWAPLLPEIIACMAGLSRMPFLPFLLALLCGSIPMAFTFAAVGHYGLESPGLAIGLSAILPIAIWPVVQRLLRSRKVDRGEVSREGQSMEESQPGGQSS